MAKIVARDDYVDNLKSMIENKCFRLLANEDLDEGTVNLLRAINVAGINMTNPIINTIIPPTNSIYIDGVSFIPGTDFAVVWGLFQFGSTQVDFISYWNAAVPGAAIPIGSSLSRAPPSRLAWKVSRRLGS